MSVVVEPGGAAPGVDWRGRLAHVVDMMREVSRQTDPQNMVKVYAARVRALTPTDRLISISRRGLSWPEFRVTRSSTWTEEINPWKQVERLPLRRGGVLAEMLYGNEARLIEDAELAEDDPAREFVGEMRSLAAIPMFDRGEALNMTVLMRREAGAFDAERYPEMVLQGNLFGRATHTLVLADDLSAALEALDREMQQVASIQRSLLPAELPKISTMELAAHYETSTQAGGDYYDFFDLGDERWGILIADVTGHGTPAAVVMAITHAIAHQFAGPHECPAAMLEHLNRELTKRYTNNSGTFVTAFYGVYDARSRALTYASAGHNPPRLKRCEDGTLTALDAAGGLPLGIEMDAEFTPARHALRPGDQIIFYTDGVTEAFNTQGEMFGTERLDRVLTACRPMASILISATLDALRDFTRGRPADDDRTILVARVR
ncbi:MAG: PP2C family protein-serine/threonine phosphatase [Phycisphaerae bacterium]